MAKRAVEHIFTGSTVAYASYDSTKTVLGPLIQQKTGATAADKFAGPFPINKARPMEAATNIPGVYPYVISWSSTIDWVFLADLATAAATRRVMLYYYNKSTQEWTWNGFITLTYPSATAHTIRGLRVLRNLYTTGTVGVSGTAVTGSSTGWQTNRYAAGARIGFGTTDPTQVTTWYHISAISSDTSITLTEDAGTVTAGSSFVIEELRVYTATTNATAANGGLFVAKGINADDFGAGGVTIAAATTTDNIKAVYWLADAATVLNTAAGSCVVGSGATDTSQIMYVQNSDAATSLRIYKYDVRVALSGLASGKSTSAFLYRTGAQTVTGTISQTNNSRIATLGHGAGEDVPSLYLATTTRVYRIAEANITSNNPTFISDVMVEIPPGSASTFAATSGMTSVEYSDTIDRLIITTGAAQRHYVTQYRTDSTAFDHVLFSDTKQIDQSAADDGTAIHPSTQSAGFSVWAEGGIGYFARNGATAIINQVYAIPIASHWDYAATTTNRLITPELTTPGLSRFYRVYVNCDQQLSSDNLGTPTEPYRLYYRTEGISDNSGAWTAVNDSGDLTSLNAATSIQFMFEFKIFGNTCLPARIHALTLTYEDDSTDSHYQPSAGNSSVVDKRFAWRFSTAFGDTVPTLTVKLYDAVTGGTLLTDTTADHASGTFQKSTDGGTNWSDYDTSDKANETTYIRYTPSSLADNVRVRALLTQ